MVSLFIDISCSIAQHALIDMKKGSSTTVDVLKNPKYKKARTIARACQILIFLRSNLLLCCQP